MMPDVNSGKVATKSSGDRSHHKVSSKSSSSHAKRPSGKADPSKSSPRPRTDRARRTRSSDSASSDSSSSSSDSDSSNSSTDSSRSSKDSPKKMARGKGSSQKIASGRDHPQSTKSSVKTHDLPSSAHSSRITETGKIQHEQKKSDPRQKTVEESNKRTVEQIADGPTTPNTSNPVVFDLSSDKPTTDISAQKSLAVDGKSRVSERVTDKHVPNRGSPIPEVPKFTRVLVEKITRNVTEAHITEIFSVWGPIVDVDMPPDRIHPEFSRGHAYVTYKDWKSAADAVNFMNGGQIDGQAVRVTEVLQHSAKLDGRSASRYETEGSKFRHRERDFDETRRESDKRFAPRSNENVDRRREEFRQREREREKERDRRERERARFRDRERQRRENDRSIAEERPRRVRRGSSGSPFASRSRPGPERPRSPITGSRYRRPSPPGPKVESGANRRGRSRSPIGKPRTSPSAAATRPTDSKPTTASNRRGRAGSRSSSSSSSSGSGSSSSSRSGSSSSSSSSSSRSRS